MTPSGGVPFRSHEGATRLLSVAMTTAATSYHLRLKCVPQFFDCVESVMKCNAEDQQRLLS